MNHLFRKHKLTLITLFLGLILILGGRDGTAVTHAADPIIVDCTDGIGDADALIAAVGEANSDSDEDTISLGENCTYTLLTALPGTENGLYALEADVILEGNSATIERGPQVPNFRLLKVENNAHLTANNLTLRGGAIAANGGAIYTELGTDLTLNQVNLEDNVAQEGGAIYTQGVTAISDSRFRSNEAVGMGGGVYATAPLIVERSDLYGNRAAGGGGAIYAAAKTFVYDSRFVANYADTFQSNGGAILAEAALTVSGGHFAFNGAQVGGGLYGRNVQITSSTFYDNYGRQYAGGVFAANAFIHGVRFDQNTAGNYSGGGLYVLGDLDLQRNYFHRNVSAGIGGGLYFSSETMTGVIENNLWVDNRSVAQVGHVMSLEVADSSTIKVRHNTVVHTDPILPGSGIIIANSKANFENNILSGFSVAIYDVSSKASARSNLYFNNSTNEVGLAAPGENSLVADPGFVSDGNYRLGEGSPAIDSAAIVETSTDILDTSRPQGDLPDRGAYEFTGEEETVFTVPCAAGVEGLAETIENTNRHFGPDVIEIEGVGCVFELPAAAGVFGEDGPAGLPAVLDTLTLDGGGATVQRQESAAPFRILETYAPNLTVQNLTVRNGRTPDSGAGILTYYQTALHLIGVNLRDNVADGYGGGVYAYSTLTVENSQVTGNRATGGGGLYGQERDVMISDSVITGNEAVESGGGVYIWLSGKVTNTLFADNHAGQNGGAISVVEMIDLQTSTLINNSAGMDGGGLYVDLAYGTISVENSVWLNNQAARLGAAVYMNGIYPNNLDASVRHNTIVGDGTPDSVAIYLYAVYDNLSFRVANNIIAAHAVGVKREGKGTLATNANLYFDNETNEVGATSSNDHVEGDPRFRDLATYDARLLEDSAAVDSAADLDVGVDRNGVERPQGNGYDIGAYEYTPNVAPTAAADTYATSQDTPLVIPAPGVLGNDEDVDGDSLTAVLESRPAHGELTLNANGSFTYTPDAGFSGDDSFTYRADDYADQTEPATVTINVLPAGTNVPPTAVPDAYTTGQGTPLAIPAPGVLDNDLDADGDVLTAVAESQPAHGALTLNANGSLTYTPNAGYTGSDSFTYRTSDGEASSAAAQVAISVLPAQQNLPPLAFGNRYEVQQDAILTISAPGVLDNDQDGDGDGLTAVLESQAAHGSLTLQADGSFTYTPAPGFSGTDRFTYRAGDGRARSAPAMVTITIRPTGGQLQRLLLPVVFSP